MLMRAIRAAALSAILASAGCGAVLDDMKELGEAFSPPTPGEAGRWIFDNHPDQRRRGVVLISNSPFGGTDVYVRAYRDIIANDRDPVVRAAAIRALARHGQVSDAPLITSQLTHANPHVRYEAAKGLQRIHNPEVTTQLIARLGDDREETKVRAAAATALGQYPDDFVFQSLVAALDAAPLSINTAAQRSLSTLTGQSLGMESEKWLTWYARADEPFAGQQEYFFPTYQRKTTILEKIAFWTEPTFESPAQPVGLRPQSTRSTYGDEEGRMDEGP